MFSDLFPLPTPVNPSPPKGLQESGLFVVKRWSLTSNMDMPPNPDQTVDFNIDGVVVEIESVLGEGILAEASGFSRPKSAVELLTDRPRTTL